MGRVYHPKERLKYLPEDVSAALAHVRRGMSIRKTARRFKIPYETLASFRIRGCSRFLRGLDFLCQIG